GETKALARGLERRARGRDQREIRDHLVVVLDDLRLDLEPRRIELARRTFRARLLRADAAEVRQIDERNVERYAAVPLVPGDDGHHLRRLPGRRQIDLRAELLAGIRPPVGRAR